MWVLEGDTGKVLEGWPVKLPSQVLAAVLVTKLVPGESKSADIVSTKHSNLRSGVPIFFRCGKERLIQLLDYWSAAP